MAGIIWIIYVLFIVELGKTLIIDIYPIHTDVAIVCA